MRAQRFPGGINVARPEKRSITLHTGISVAMKSVWPLIGPIDLRAFPVHANTREPGRDVQRIAFIGPPSINAFGKDLAVHVPITSSRLLIKARHLARLVDRAVKSPRKNHNMRDHFEVLAMKLVDHLLWIREDSLVPGE
jgi:hypothetical protein